MADESAKPEAEPQLEGAGLVWFADHVELDLTDHGRPEADDGPVRESSGVSTHSDRAAQLESDHWRERAVLWRERALAAELVAKMLQRNLDDLRANLEDLRSESRPRAGVQALDSPSDRFRYALAAWRHFVRAVYEKYMR